VSEVQTGSTIEAKALGECARCGFGNPPGMSFCGSCGAPLAAICPTCGTSNPQRFRFCGGCGATIVRSQATASKPAHEVAAAIREAERRQLTVMFCDLVGSTALSLKIDPEELREILRSYQAVCADSIERFGGYIAQYLGDGVLVYFGYPVALENEAERAVRAGLRVLEEMGRLNAALRNRTGDEMAIRIGIHTGLVVVDEVGGGARRENLALGGTPNIAARLQGLAQPDTIVISAVTQRLVARHFNCEDLGPAQLRGVTGIGSAWRVVGERIRPRGGRRTRLVGRDAELGVLLERWQHVLEGSGQQVLITGDAGIGKSHLVDDFLDRVKSTTHVVLECRCQAYYQSTALFPIIDFIERDLGFAPGQGDDNRLNALRAMLERDELPVEEMLPLFASLLELPYSARDETPAGTPEGRRDHTRAALIRFILRAVDTSPVILIIEDLHWADPSTLDLIEQLIPRLRAARIFALFTTRPGFSPSWRREDHTAILDLGRLSHPEAENIVRTVAGKPLPASVVNEIVTRTDGVPLFVEELTKTVLQSGLLEEREDRYVLDGPLPPLAIPATLKDSLEARLDRLAAVKEIAQFGATLGREFSWAILQAVAQLEDATLAAALAQLVDAELIWVDGAPPDATYTFKHALIQETAYESLLRSTRQRYHRRIATVLEREFREIAETEPETLAHHYTRAELPERAVPHWLHAGRRALERSANVEAGAHLRRGLELLRLMPPSEERSWIEIEFQAALGTALISTEGYTSPGVHVAYDRARTLCHEVNDTARIAPVLTGLFAYYIVRRELIPATELAIELNALAETVEDDQIELMASVANGVLEFNRGNLTNGRLALEHSLRLYDPERHAPLVVSFGHDLGVICHSFLSVLLWYQGEVDKGLEASRQAIDLARRIRHAHSLALALAFAGSLRLGLSDNEGAATFAEELLALSTEWGFKHWQGDAVLTQACILACNGQGHAAEERIEAAAVLFRDRGTGADPQYDIRVARALGAAGRLDEGIRLIESDVSDSQTTRVTRWNTEFYLLLAELLANHTEREPETEVWLQRAIEQAKRDGAAFLEMVAAARLAERMAVRGEAEEARALLAPVYARITEGRDSVPLRAAASLLDRLDAAIAANRGHQT
jgi:class 3 adenylate cyclase/predicted ATPase